MNEEQKLQALLRLKRHETPPEGYFEDFLKEFQERQRQEILQRGSLSLLWERVQTWVDGLRRPAVAWSLAGAYSVLLLLICLWPRQTRSGSMVAIWATQGNPPAASPGNVAPPPPRGAMLVNDTHETLPPPVKKRSMNPDGTTPLIGAPAELPPESHDDIPPPPAGTLREL